jgi:tetratricopeptide (TPR) repeat protein
VEKAEALKADGNGFIKSKDYAKAVRNYTEAYNLIINDPSEKSQELKLSLVSNLALATLNVGDFSAALGWCNTHLEETIDPNAKIVYRKASANKGLKNWEAAKKDILFGIKQSAHDDETIKNFNGLLAQLEKE